MFKTYIKWIIECIGLLVKRKISFVLTSKVNHDSMKNFFATVIGKIQRSVKKLLCVKLFHTGTKNCKSDTDRMLLKLNDL